MIQIIENYVTHLDTILKYFELNNKNIAYQNVEDVDKVVFR